MIRGIGVDLVKMSRFISWAGASQEKLLRVFSENELRDCITPTKGYDPVKLAARFAAKEAFFKALSATLINLKRTEQTSTLLAVCKHVEVVSSLWGVPTLRIRWAEIVGLEKEKTLRFKTHLSLSHEGEYATAFVVIELE